MVDINGTTSIGSLWTQNARRPEIDGQQKPGAGSFGQWLDRSIQEVNQMQQESDAAAARLVSGENKDIHGTMVALQKADIAMNLMLEVRNKVVAAYEEIKRMQF